MVTGSPDITVAVIDDGVEHNHEDMLNCVLSGYTAENPSGNGNPQNENQYNPKGHGTACAGIIAAEDNTIGIKGIAHGVKILPVNVFPNYATNNGTDMGRRRRLVRLEKALYAAGKGTDMGSSGKLAAPIKRVR